MVTAHDPPDRPHPDQAAPERGVDPHGRARAVRGAAGAEVAGALGAGPAVRDRAPGPTGRGRGRHRRVEADGSYAARGTMRAPRPMATGSRPNPPPSPRPADPRQAFRWALARYKGSRLAAIRLAQGLSPTEDRIRPAGTAEEVAERLDQPATVEALAAGLPLGSRLAATLLDRKSTRL